MKRQLHRRDFLKSAAGLAAGVSLFPLAASPAARRRKRQSRGPIVSWRCAVKWMGNGDQKRLPSPDVLKETDLIIYPDLFQPLSTYMFPWRAAIDGIDVQIIEVVCEAVETGGKVTIACATL